MTSMNKVFADLPVTVFEAMSQAARDNNAINLGQHARFVNRVCQRFLTKAVLAHSHRHRRGRAVVVVGCADGQSRVGSAMASSASVNASSGSAS